MILMIHGYRCKEEDLFSFAEDLPYEFYVISVRATHTLSPGMYAWYAIDFVNMEKFNNVPQALESRNQLVKLMDEISAQEDRKSTRLNSIHVRISYAVFCLKKKKKYKKKKN